jgi:hypothetical protein
MNLKTKYLAILLLVACNRNTSKVIYQDRVVTQVDTIKFESPRDGTEVPCKDFETFIQGETIHDTVFIKSKAGKLQLKAQLERKVVERQPIVVTPQPKRVKIDNSVTAKKGGIIGDGNTQTNNTKWWWIFFSGMITMYLSQNVIIKGLKIHFPFLRFLP